MASKPESGETAERMAGKQREISLSQFFLKKKQFLP